MVIEDKNKFLRPTAAQPPEETLDTKEILTKVYEALEEKGYNPLHQIVGYILSEDPTYITNYANARGLIRRIDRDALLEELVREYLGIEKGNDDK